jgi:hypothetical protein
MKIRGEIEENLKFNGQLMVKLHKSKTKDQIERTMKFRVDIEIRQGQNSIK